MRGLVNPGGASASTSAPRPDPNHVRALKAVVRASLQLDLDATVVVQQLACVEPGCPPVETVIAVLGTPRRTWKIPTPTAAVSAAELDTLLKNHPEGNPHDHTD
jgi:hypothetical protein